MLLKMKGENKIKIHLLGPSGSGTTTLGKLLARNLNTPHFDTDDFFWVSTDPPFTEKRSKKQRTELLKTSLQGCDSWVLSGSMLDWGDFLLPEIDIIIYKYVSQELRINRLKKREKERHGDRLKSGNDMHSLHLDFIKWASGYETGGLEMRSRKSEEVWMNLASCKIIRLETEMPIDDELKYVIEQIME